MESLAEGDELEVWYVDNGDFRNFLKVETVTDGLPF